MIHSSVGVFFFSSIKYIPVCFCPWFADVQRIKKKVFWRSYELLAGTPTRRFPQLCIKYIPQQY